MHDAAEILACSNFTFLTGASHADEMVAQAAALGLSAIGIADRNSFAGIVRAHLAAREAGIKLLIGVRLVTVCGFQAVAYPRDREAYGRLTRMLTDANFRSVKGQCDLWLDDIIRVSDGQILLIIPPRENDLDWQEKTSTFLAAIQDRAALVLTRGFDGDDGRRLYALTRLARDWDIPTIATTDARFHAPGRKPLADVMTCIREHVPIKRAGFHLAANAERHLKPPHELYRIFQGYEDAVARSLALADEINFCLDELVYQYPEEVIGEGETPMQTLRRLTRDGMEMRYPAGPPAKIAQAVKQELTLIEQLDYAPYFLTVYDIVRFARSQGILCQGRGSAANSAVCYIIGITEVDPARIDLLFERFVSAERGEPPDIDVDFEHERREEVIQYVYEKYGRRRAAMTATVNCYRPRGAIREVGKVFGLSGDIISALSKTLWGWHSDDLTDDRIRDELGLDPNAEEIRQTLRYARELMGFPRHLSQHPGGFVMTQGRLDEIVPLHNAAMPDRTVLEWDKEDIDALGLMKADVLGLGMLTCVARAMEMIRTVYQRPMQVSDIPPEDPAVYDMICKADTVGVFQIESRAQMTMLPRLKPRNFYDLVIEVAIVRPGPIQGDMVHPYLRRRDGLESVKFPSAALEEVLGKTLGVPLFQEQAMRIAIVAAGFTPAESDKLRRSMAAFRRSGTIHEMGRKLVSGMIANGYEPDFAERCFKQLEGFGEYGFPESHAASFALIVYVSCWLKRYFPDVFLAALLNAQPMGFYAPGTLVEDARRRGVRVLPIDINHSAWDCGLERDPADGALQIRMGFRYVKSLGERERVHLDPPRGRPFRDVESFVRHIRINRKAHLALAEAGAFEELGVARRDAIWQVRGALTRLQDELDLKTEQTAQQPLFQGLSPAEQVLWDYRSSLHSPRGHPMMVARPRLQALGIPDSATVGQLKDGARTRYVGMVICRQRPGTASGVTFMTLEDESGFVNLVVWAQIFERHKVVGKTALLLGVTGKIQSMDGVVHLIADSLWVPDLEFRADSVSKSRDFH